MKDVADMLRIQGSSATVIIDRLVLNGELVRMEDPGDRRVVRIGITEAGKKILKSGMKDSIAGMDKLLLFWMKGARGIRQAYYKIISQK